MAIGGTLQAELLRTAELLVEIANRHGVYFAVALLYDSSYDLSRLQRLLPVLVNTPGARKEAECHLSVNT